MIGRSQGNERLQVMTPNGMLFEVRVSSKTKINTMKCELMLTYDTPAYMFIQCV